MTNKKKKILPSRGDRVQRRGYNSIGVLQTIDEEYMWAVVDWENDGPKYIHLYELETLASVAQ